jgi:hypothetical protein
MVTLPLADQIVGPLSDAVGRLVDALRWNNYYVGMALGWGGYWVLRSRGLMSWDRLDFDGKFFASIIWSILIGMTCVFTLYLLGFIE